MTPIPRCFKCESTVTVNFGSAAATLSVISSCNCAGSIPVCCRRILNVTGQSCVRKLPSRNVHGNAHRFTAGMIRLPLPQLPACLDQQPVADRHQHPAIFGGFNEAVRRNQSLCRMIPAQQRLEAHNVARRQVHDRMVDRCGSAEFPSPCANPVPVSGGPTARVCIASSNTSQREPPIALARRSATSASLRIPSGRSCSIVLKAIPMLTEIRVSRDSTMKGSATAACIRFATRSASLGSPSPSNRMANSSPLRRKSTASPGNPGLAAGDQIVLPELRSKPPADLR